jgi:ketosteroid isomerase-like protein
MVPSLVSRVTGFSPNGAKDEAAVRVHQEKQIAGVCVMSDIDKERIIRALFAAYLANNRKAVEDVLSPDFHFTSPYDDRIDKRTYFERCWRSSDWIERHELERIFVRGDEAFATYKCVAKGGKSFRNTEFFIFESEKVKSIDVYFGATYQDGVFVKQPS